jgi:hypothetical protein
MKPDNTPHTDANQGEGDKVAARHYNQQLRDFVAGGKVEPAARAAESYVESQPADAARAERKAKAGPSSKVSLDELMAKGRSVVERVRPVVERAIGKLRARFDRK